jgi:hypothetical protein
MESLDNEQDNDSVSNIDLNRVGFTPGTSVALADTKDSGEGADKHPYEYADDPCARTPTSVNDSMDERDVESMLLAEQEQSMQDDDEEQYSIRG